MRRIWATVFILNLFSISLAWNWKCEKNLCIRENFNSTYSTIEECRLVCGSGSVWPIPTVKFTKSNELIKIDANLIVFEIQAPSGVKSMIEKNIEIFRQNILAECGGTCSSDSAVSIKIIISVNSDDFTLNWTTDESYKISGKDLTWKLNAETAFGARHALETMSHLIANSIYDNKNCLVTIKEVEIEDKPFYAHRSLLLDTARNYLSVDTLKRQIDGMAASKLNVFHWHITDSQSFPYVSKRVPNLSKYGAFSEEKIFSEKDVNELISYAKTRGVRIIMEIDSPSHAGNGWQWGPDNNLGNLSVCINQQPWRTYCIEPPCGQLNPANPNLYTVLGNLYRDIVDQFPASEVFHMGGDEVFLNCWNTTQEIIDYLTAQGKGRTKSDFLDLWSEFQNNILNVYDSIVGHQNTSIILWSSMLTDPDVITKYLNKDRYIIETWVPSTDPIPLQLLNLGYKLIISTKNAWYLDHGFWGTTTYYTWRTAYTNKLVQHDNVLGGEVCMWGEFIDGNALDGRIWPRAAAVAERLWSNPSTNTAAAESRMYRQRERLVTRGIDAEALVPFWCYQNDGKCQ